MFGSEPRNNVTQGFYTHMRRYELFFCGYFLPIAIDIEPWGESSV